MIKYPFTVLVFISLLLFISFSNFKTNPISPLKDINEGKFGLLCLVLDSNDTVYTVVDKMPEFVGGDDALTKYISQNLKYPPDALENEIQGSVIVEFIITKDGSIINPEVIKQIGFGCNEEALRLVNNMPKWEPGKQNGKNVNVRIKQRIRFTYRLNRDSIYFEHYFAERELDTLARYKKGEEDFTNDLVKSYKRPANIPDTIHGQVWFNIFLNKEGTIDSIHVFDSPHQEISLEIINAIKKLPYWSPAIKKGRKVRSINHFNLPVVMQVKRQMPEYIGGEDAMKLFILENFIYAKLSTDLSFKGAVIVEFVVRKDGKIINAKVIKGFGYGCDKEALRVINAMPDWYPGVLTGKAADFKYRVTFPIYLK